MTHIAPHLTRADTIVIRNLLRDVQHTNTPDDDTSTPDDVGVLSALTDEKDASFEPTVFTNWDLKDLPPVIQALLRPYVSWAQTVVRRPTDIVFLTHIILYLSTSVPSAVYLYHQFSYPRALFHWLLQAYYCGPFTLLLHNHIHNNGLLAKKYAWLDRAFPYILEPLMGHTWDSYYYHHVKHHHVEGNGPDDLSSTVRYQRDEFVDFAMYVGRFLFLIWIELPMYFWGRGRKELAMKTVLSELASYVFIFLMATRVNTRATVFVLLLPLLQMRIGMMTGNWGQHAFVDEAEPDSDYRSSITLIDVPSNRHCFNDGYHLSHHLNPRRHWRDHPAAFLSSKPQYQQGRALVFHKIDYLMITFYLLRKDYHRLAKSFVPIGEDQIKMSLEEVVDMLRSKTKRFTEEDIRIKWGRKI